MKGRRFMTKLSFITILITLFLAIPVSDLCPQERTENGGHYDNGLNPNQITEPDPDPDATESEPAPDTETSEDLTNYIDSTDRKTEPGD